MSVGEKSVPVLHELRSHKLSMIGEDVIKMLEAIMRHRMANGPFAATTRAAR